jgi:hypothetical protein
MDFLENKTIKLQQLDVAFIHSQIYLYSLFLTCELDSNKLKPDSTAWDNGSWEGIVPNVRLIEIVLSDEFRLDFVHQNDAQSRQQLDARGTESQTILFWEKVRRKFNDRTFEKSSLIVRNYYKNLHVKRDFLIVIISILNRNNRSVQAGSFNFFSHL